LPKRTAFGVYVYLLALAALAFAGCGTPRESAFDLRAPRTLQLLTYDGSGQLVHPDVVRWPRSGGDLWMAVTPYPYAREKWENPSIYRSRDGLTWRASTTTATRISWCAATRCACST
jgi:hypothetical protein